MRFELHDLPLSDNPLAADLDVKSFMQFDPQLPDSLAACRDCVLGHNNVDRARLSALLSAYNRSVDADAPALLNCERLLQTNAVVVVTGQQAGLFSGPLYTIYKIVTAINLARQLEQQFATPVIPVFWNATEDHDLSEAFTLRSPGRRHTVSAADAGRAVETVAMRSGMSDFVAGYIDGISPYHRRDEIAHLLRIDSDRYGAYASSVIARLFAGTGLVILEPYLLRPLHPDWLQHAIDRRGDIVSCLRSAGDVLTSLGIKPAFAPEQQNTGLFHINEDGIRRRVIDQGRYYLVDARRTDGEALDEMVAAHTQRFSTGAALRPVFQSSALPNVAYIAGPAEWRYHLQLRDVYRCFDAVMPVIRLRNHGTIVTAREQKLMTKLNVAGADIFRGPTALYNARPMPDQFDKALSTAEHTAQQAITRLVSDLRDIADHERLDTLSLQVSRPLASMRHHVLRNLLRREEVDNHRIDRLFDVVLPAGLRQERVLNIMHFIGIYGRGLISRIIEALDPWEEQHYLLYPDEEEYQS